MSYRSSTRTSSGRQVQVSEKYKAVLLKHAEKEYNRLYDAAYSQGRLLFGSIKSGEVRQIVKEQLSEWIRLYEETLGMQQEIENLVPEEELDAKVDELCSRLDVFDGLRDEVLTYLDDSPRTHARVGGEESKQWLTLQQETRDLEEEIKAMGLDITRSLEKRTSTEKSLAQAGMNAGAVGTSGLGLPLGLPTSTPKKEVDVPLYTPIYPKQEVTSGMKKIPVNAAPIVTGNLAIPSSGVRVNPAFSSAGNKVNATPLIPAPRVPISVAPRPAKRERILKKPEPLPDPPPGFQPMPPDPNIAIQAVLEKLANAIAESTKKEHLPKKEPSVFDGELIRFPAWLHSFETLVELHKSDDAERAYYLGVYTSGNAKEAIQGILDSKTPGAYQRAKSILISRFGDTFKTTEAFKTKLYSWPFIKKGDGEALTKFSDFLWQCHNSMNLFGNLLPLDCPDENAKLARKLPYNTAERWARSVNRWAQQYKLGIAESSHVTPFPPFVEFCCFVTEEAQIATGPISFMKKETETTPPSNGSRRKQATFATAAASGGGRPPASGQQDNDRRTQYGPPPPYCSYCKGSHYISYCNTFLQQPSEKRREFAMQNGMCFGCLLRNHQYKDCKRRNPALLLGVPIPKEKGSSYQVAQGTGDRLHSMIVPVSISHVGLDKPKFNCVTYAVLDNQSDCCLISDSLVEELGLKSFTNPVSLELTTVNSVTEEKSSLLFGLLVKGLDYKEQEIQLPKCYTQRSINANRSRIPRPDSIGSWPHLSPIADELFEYMPNVEVGLLIGYNCSAALFPLQQITGGLYEPFATRTPLGWGITGSSVNPNLNTSVFCNATRSKELLTDDMKKIFNDGFVDAYDDRTISAEDQKFVNIMEKGFKQLPDGHIQLPLPFKDPDVNVISNRPMALQRLLSLKRRLLDDEMFYEHFKTGIQKMIDKGFAEPVPVADLKRNDGRVLYLPIQGVWHPKKIADLRIVMDGGALFMGFSLNGLLMTGPDYLSNLVAILCRFREKRYAFTCDIEGMFMQVLVEPDDRDMLRFLWFDEHDLEKGIKEYRMVAHLFGASSSPAVVNHALKTVAKKYKHEFGEEVSDFVLRHFYMDDGLKSCDETEEMVNLMQGSHDLCKKGGFNLHKYLCNDGEAIERIPESLRAKGIREIDFRAPQQPGQAVERTLGMSWQFVRDLFLFIFNLQKKPMTRRGLLSSSSSIFDPLGLLAPILIIGKLILQSVCQSKIRWDDKIPGEIEIKWLEWYLDLKDIQHLEIPRCVQGSGRNVEFELHLFSDASSKAYGYCAYIRARDEENVIVTNLMSAKAKVMPSKVVTIPRLELQAALMAARACQFLKRELTLELSEVVLWTDSSIVLSYLKNEAKRFQVFVSNRVSQIQELTEDATWRHIDTASNPADILSRGITAKELKGKELWWKGPDIIRNNWILPPCIFSSAVIPDTDPEVRKQNVQLTEIKEKAKAILQPLENVSSWEKMVRIIAIWRRYLLNLKQKIDTGVMPTLTEEVKLTVNELQRAELVVLSSAQKDAFPEIFEKLEDKPYPENHASAKKRKTALRPRSNLYRLDIFVDKFGIMRVGGRVKRGNIPRNLIHPVVLPKSHFVTRALISYYHERCLHAGRGITMNELRSRGYWIFRGRTAVAGFITACVICRKLRGPTVTQKMADLPKERVEQSAPFTEVGVDFFGPYVIRSGRTERKRWICAFTCYYTRAAHMEVCHLMNTDSFLNAYRRFTNRRGAVRKIQCDRGSNFVGASNELEKALLEMDESRIGKELAKEGCDFVTFSFNSPKASHMGGLWERMIRTARQGLNHLLVQHAGQLDDELLHTLVTEVEAVINSRPLTCVDMVDGDAPEPLSPMQILTLKHKVVAPLPGKFVQQDLYCRKRWRRVQHLANEFWKKWLRDFLPSLQERKKWQDPVFSLLVEDVVLVVDESLPRNSWSMGVVEELIVSHDDAVRRVKLRTTSGVYERPVHKLIFLFRVSEIEKVGEEVPS